MVPLPLSALFVPGHRADRYAKAAAVGAGAVIVDLEDAVPPTEKEAARRALAATDAFGTGGPWVRVRPGLLDIGDDLRAAVAAGAAAIMLPKALTAGAVAALAAALGELGSSAAIVPLIEDPAALSHLSAIAHGPRVTALAFGPEDFAAGAGTRPEPAALTLPAQQVALAAAAAGIGALGYPSTIGETRDLDRLRADMALGRAIGFGGALCIHPAQVTVAHSVFAPTDRERGWAARVLAAYDPASGAALVDGKMIDAPVVARARAIAARPGGGS